MALLALNRLVENNPTYASKLTLNAIENNRYMDDILLACDSDLEIVAKEIRDLMERHGFKLRKWVSYGHAKSILLNVPRCGLVSSVSEIDLGSQPLPDSTALGLVRDTEKDKLLVNLREFCEASTRRQLASQLASQFLIPWKRRRRSSLGLDWFCKRSRSRVLTGTMFCRWILRISGKSGFYC